MGVMVLRFKNRTEYMCNSPGDIEMTDEYYKCSKQGTKIQHRSKYMSSLQVRAYLYNPPPNKLT